MNTMKESARRQPAALLVSSSGGHWVQLSKIAEGLDGMTYDVATVDASAVANLAARRVFTIADFNRDTPLGAMLGMYSVMSAVARSRTTHIISTGAAPGLVAIVFGRLIGRRTLWIDSIANANRLSVSGRVAAVVAHSVLSQWEDVAGKHPRVQYQGRVA